MNLREVREWAAMGHDYVRSPVLQNVMQHILATIDTEPDAAITADWLVENYGLERTGHSPSWCTLTTPDIRYATEYVIADFKDDVLSRFVMGGKGVMCNGIPTTRQQFCDLAKALGIPRKDGAK